MHSFAPLLYPIYWLLHVSAVVCHHQGASWVCLSYLKYEGKSENKVPCFTATK
jgi:hypothetical protein